jgi:hypothetical protein
MVDRMFDEVKIVPHEKATAGSLKRAFRDSSSTVRPLLWHNGTRSDAYALSPFDETILIDSDYLVMDRSLDQVWGGPDDVMIPKRVVPLDGTAPLPVDRRITPYGICMRWATLVYFRKGKTAEALFDMVAHIRQTYSFWKQAHNLPGALYRNDFSFSIAAHMLDGWTEDSPLIPEIPGPGLLHTTDRDELIGVPEPGSLLFLCNDQREDWRYRIVRADGLSVHAMNKFAIGRHANRLLSLHGFPV